MAFEWRRMHKWEENFEREATDGVEEQICEHYGVEDALALTREQLLEVVAFRDEHVSEYSPMFIGFNNIINRWEDDQEEE